MNVFHSKNIQLVGTNFVLSVDGFGRRLWTYVIKMKGRSKWYIQMNMVYSKNIQLVETNIVLSVDEFGRRLWIYVIKMKG